MGQGWPFPALFLLWIWTGHVIFEPKGIGILVGTRCETPGPPDIGLVKHYFFLITYTFAQQFPDCWTAGGGNNPPPSVF